MIIITLIPPPGWREGNASLTGNFLIESFDHLIPFGNVAAHGLPEALAFAGFEGFDIDALLLAPGEVTEVEDAFAVALREFDDVVGVEAEDVLAVGFGGIECVEIGFAVVIAAEDEAFFGAVHAGAVGGNGHHDVVFAEFHHLGHLDRRQDVGDRREAEVFEAIEEFGFDAIAFGEELAAGFAVIQAEDVVGGFVAEAEDVICVHHVVDERHVFVADTLDVVIAETVVEERRAFEGFDSNDLGAVVILEVIACADGAGRTGGRYECTELGVCMGLLEVFEDVFEGRAGAEVMCEVIIEFSELIEDEVLGILGEFVAFVVDFLDVGFAAIGGDDVFVGIDGPFAEPLEAFLAHAFGQDRDATAVHEAADGDATTAIVTGGRPNGAVLGGIEGAEDDARSQASIGSKNFVGSNHRGEAADHRDDGGIDTGHFLGQHEVNGDVDERAAILTIVPVNAVQVEGIGGIRIDIGEFGLDVSRDFAGIGQHGESRQRELLLFKTSSGLIDGLLIGDFRRYTKSC